MRAPRLISVIVTCYNHQRYLAQCLDGVLAQAGDFQMEVLIGDDASTDRTRAMAEEYARRHPGLLRLLPAAPNLGVTKNLQRCLHACRGEYIAICEGDDYWTDGRKLQKQMEFLDANPQCSMCFSAIMLHYVDRDLFLPHDQFRIERDLLSTTDLIDYNWIGNFSCCMYRAEAVRRLPEGLYDLFTVDWFFNINISRQGPVGFLRGWMSVYRKHALGAWAGKPFREQTDELLQLIGQYDEFLGYEYAEAFAHQKAAIREAVRIREEQEAGVPGAAIPAAGLPPAAWPTWVARLPEPAKRVLRPVARRLSGVSESIRIWRRSGATWWQAARMPLGRKRVRLLILDTIFPHPLSPFRFQEFTTYLDAFPRSAVLTTGDHLTAVGEGRPAAEVILEFLGRHPEYRGRVSLGTHAIDGFQPDFAYLVFLNNISYFLPALERRRIPFLFTLYPGGGFRLDDAETDGRLFRILHSPQFRGVIVTQKNVRDYLLLKNLCPPERIHFLYGVVMPLASLAPVDRPGPRFGSGKDTLDICFVAHKYMPGGVDKGYDVFLESARLLAARRADVRFHVVGNFGLEDWAIDGLEGRIRFYGTREPEWFDSFYRDKDIILSPNIPFRLLPGMFDGFPTTSCTEAGAREVAMFCTDELDLNVRFTDGEDIVLIPHDAERIAERVEHFARQPGGLRRIAQNGARTIREVYGFESQLAPRLEILRAAMAEPGRSD